MKIVVLRLTLNHWGLVLIHFSASSRASLYLFKLRYAKQRLLRRAFIRSLFDSGVNSMARLLNSAIKQYLFSPYSSLPQSFHCLAQSTQQNEKMTHLTFSLLQERAKEQKMKLRIIMALGNWLDGFFSHRWSNQSGLLLSHSFAFSVIS